MCRTKRQAPAMEPARAGPRHGGGGQAAQQVCEHGNERAVQARLGAGRAGRRLPRRHTAPHRRQRRSHRAQVRRHALAQHLAPRAHTRLSVAATLTCYTSPLCSRS